MKKRVILCLALILLASLAGITKIHDSRVKPDLPPFSIVEVDHNVESLNWLRSFFLKHETINAEELAIALLLCPPDYREVLAAIAVRETNGDPTVIGSVGEKGIFQVREKYWGRVPQDIAGQVLQASYIYATLHKSYGSEYRAVKAYNGSGYKAERYAYAVLAMKGE